MSEENRSSSSFSISQVSARTGLTRDTLRWYEQEGLIPEVPRDHAGVRRYDEAQVKIVELLVKLRRTGMPVAQMREFTTLLGQGVRTHGQRMRILDDHRDNIRTHIRECGDDLRAVEEKSEHYRVLISQGLDCAGTPVTSGPVFLGDGLATSRLGFGAMALTPVYGGTDDEHALRVLNHAVDIGVTFIDTADVYGAPRLGTTGPAGTNEELLSRLLRERREEVTIATKFGITGAIGPSKDPRVANAGQRTRGDQAYVQHCLEESLRRLDTDVIDLWYLHRLDPDIPVEDTIGFMAEQVLAGKVRHLGPSEVTALELRRAHKVHPIAAVQSEWSLWSRDVEKKVVPVCAELGVGFVPYSPLGRGFLTGTLSREQISGDARSGMQRINEHWDANQNALSVVSEVAERVGVTNAQVCLAWLIDARRRHGLTVVPIPGTRSPLRVEENAATVDIVLDQQALDALNSVASMVAGSRNIVEDPTWISSGRE